MTSTTSDPHGRRLPIKLDPTTNGEFAPIPLDATGRLANRVAQEWASANARRRGLGRRAFLVSACGAASTLLAFNAVQAAAGNTGGTFELPPDAAVDPSSRRRSSTGASSFSTCKGTLLARRRSRRAPATAPTISSRMSSLTVTPT